VLGEHRDQHLGHLRGALAQHAELIEDDRKRHADVDDVGGSSDTGITTSNSIARWTIVRSISGKRAISSSMPSSTSDSVVPSARSIARSKPSRSPTLRRSDHACSRSSIAASE
jgi:hypothetical protein